MQIPSSFPQRNRPLTMAPHGIVACPHYLASLAGVDILKNGGKRQNLEAKIFGGGRIIANMTDVGMRNIAFARDYLETEGLKISSEDVGDTFPRLVVYFPATGKVKVKRLRSLHNNVIAEQETMYLNTIEEKPVSGDIELF